MILVIATRREGSLMSTLAARLAWMPIVAATMLVVLAATGCAPCAGKTPELVVRPPEAYRRVDPPMSDPVAHFYAKGGTITEQLVPSVFPQKPWRDHKAISGYIESFHLDLYADLGEMIDSSASLDDLESKLKAAGYSVERGCAP
jgi:(2Fe-2S) ferredoxin